MIKLIIRMLRFKLLPEAVKSPPPPLRPVMIRDSDELEIEGGKEKCFDFFFFFQK